MNYIILNICYKSQVPSYFLNSCANLKNTVYDFNDCFMGVGTTLASKVVVVVCYDKKRSV